jgi:cytochrome c-type biogenesis protein
MIPDVSIAVSFAAGLLSFLSPCVVPLVPSYLSYIGGVTFQDLSEDRERPAVFLRTLFFVLGFSIVFIVLGVLFSSSGLLLSGISDGIARVSGTVVVVLGLNMIFDFWKFLQIEKRFTLKTAPKGYAGSFLIGTAFGAGWTPCIGPILAGILFLAGTSGSVARGVLYLSVYSLGLGLPFLVAGAFFSRFHSYLNRVRRHFRNIRIGAGVFLVFIGILIGTGRFQQLSAVLFRAAMMLEQWSETHPDTARTIGAGILLAVGTLPAGLVAWRRRGLPGFRSLIWWAACVVLAVLETAGVLGITGLVVRWLTYQGI